MIAGPELTDDRAVVLDLLASQPDLIENDMVLVEQELELGSRIVLDGLLRDAAGRPTLLFVLAEGEGAEVASRILHADAWVRENFFLMRRFLGETGIHWDTPPRCVVIGQEVLPSSLQGLHVITKVEIDLFELRSMRVGEQKFWAAVPRFGSATQEGPRGAEQAFLSIKDPDLRTLWERMREAVRKIDREIIFEGDRYREDALWKGWQLGTFRAAEGMICVQIATHEGSVLGSVEDALQVHDDRSLRLAVDGLLRRYLSLHKKSTPRRVPEAPAAGASKLLDLPNPRLPARGFGEGGREDPSDFKPHVLRSS